MRTPNVLRHTVFTSDPNRPPHRELTVVGARAEIEAIVERNNVAQTSRSRPALAVERVASAAERNKNEKPVTVIAAEMTADNDCGPLKAEREGFEPSVEVLPLRRFSKPLPSATRPPLP